MRIVAIAIAIVLSFGISRVFASQTEDFAVLERDAAQVLRAEAASFPTLAALVARLEAGSERAPDASQRGRLGLLWLRTMRALLASIGLASSDDERFRDWLERHETVVIYSEPAGQWLIIPDVVWRVHAAHRSTPSAEAIAWLAVENGYPGECEGYIPCYGNILNWLDGEYLRRHPRGAHVSDAVGQVHSRLAEALKRLSTDPDTRRYLDPATDCGDLKAGLVPLRAAVLASNGTRRNETVGVIDVLLARC
jgi:hypothetical protein